MKRMSMIVSLAVGLFLFTACGGNGKNVEEQAIDIIVNYAETNGDATQPTVEDYTNTGVVGVNSENISELNNLVATLTGEDVDTAEEIQALLGESENNAPVVKLPKSPIRIKTGEKIKISDKGSYDIDGDILTYKWTEGDKLLGTDKFIIFQKNKVGNYTITLTVTDDLGLSGSADVRIEVKQKFISKTLTHNGTSYKTIKSKKTGKIWLDRNLGAANVCESFDDTGCYGDYYQWGRGFDGHEDSMSPVTSILATNVNDVGHGKFIVNVNSAYDWTSIDGNGKIREKNWSKVDGSSICPKGFRVPTIIELKSELFSPYALNIKNRNDAFKSFLKLPSEGYREYSSGDIIREGDFGGLWVTSVLGPYSRAISYDENGASATHDNRAGALSVRCISQ